MAGGATVVRGPPRESTPVTSAAATAENKAVKTRNGSHDDVPSDGGDLENWLHDLVDGETTARQLRKRMRAAGERREEVCTICVGGATGKIYFGPEGHLHGRRSA